MVEGESLEQALRRNDRLYANLTAPPDAVAAWEIDSLSPILPSLARQREMRPLEQIDVAAVRRSLRIAARRLKLPPGAFAPFSDRLAAFQSAARAADPLELHDVADVDLLGRIQARAVHVGGVYRVLTVVHPLTESTKDLLSAFPSMQAKAGKGIDSAALRFDSEGLQNQRVSETVLYSMALMVLLATLSLLICLLPHFHGRLDRTLLAMLPLACATIWTLGFLAFLRLYIGLYSLLVFPLVIALAVDQAVLLIQRLGDRRYASLRQALRSGGRPNVVSGLALLLGLGCLGQINVPALQEMVLVSAAAIACSTVSTVVLIPALLQVREEGGLAAWRADSED
jgi:predicted exporter